VTVYARKGGRRPGGSRKCTRLRSPADVERYALQSVSDHDPIGESGPDEDADHPRIIGSDHRVEPPNAGRPRPASEVFQQQGRGSETLSVVGDEEGDFSTARIRTVGHVFPVGDHGRRRRPGKFEEEGDTVDRAAGCQDLGGHDFGALDREEAELQRVHRRVAEELQYPRAVGGKSVAHTDGRAVPEAARLLPGRAGRKNARHRSPHPAHPVALQRPKVNPD